MTRKKRKPKPATSTVDRLIEGWAKTLDAVPLMMLLDHLEGDVDGEDPELLRAVKTALGNTDLAPGMVWHWQHNGNIPHAPHRFREAVVMAHAEWWCGRAGYGAEWVSDPEYNPADWDGPGGPPAAIAWGCVVSCHCLACDGYDWGQRQHQTEESLWCITFGGDGHPDGNPYKRVVEAQLMREVFLQIHPEK